jgi:hypothetical protein
VFAHQRIDPRLLQVVDLALEELFTNMVKYSTTSDADVRIDMTGIEGGVEVTLTDYDVDPFDDGARRGRRCRSTSGGPGSRAAPDSAALDSIEYEYTAQPAEPITFRRRRRNRRLPKAQSDKGNNARD